MATTMAQQRYDGVAIFFHWLIAALVIPLVILGIGGEAVGGLFGMDGLATIFLHKSLGLTVFVVTLIRVAWRLTHRPPALPDNTPAWQHRASSAVHASFYGLLLALPVLGYLLSSASRFPLEWFGVGLPKADVPEWVSESANLAHVVGGLVLAALLVAHIAAALWHQFVQRDRLLGRMGLG